MKKINRKELKNKIVKYLKSQGFKINPHLRLVEQSKESIRKVHYLKRKEQLRNHSKFLLRNFNLIKNHCVSGKNLDPKKIDLKLIEIHSGSKYEKIFLWWNLIWWSLPYTRPIGRQMRFLLWDIEQDAPFGLIGLQSPPLRSSVRDEFLGLNKENVDYWINQSLYGQRIGALPPYNELIGGKMVALALTSNEIRERYAEKYDNKKTLLNKRILPNRLLFITTTSAFGKSSMYERINYKSERVSKFIGFTEGSGTFHISEELYEDCLQFLEQLGINVKRGYGTGPSRKLKLIDRAFKKLNIPNLLYHQIKRGYYLFSNVENLHEIIHNDQDPIFNDRPFNNLLEFWLKRWCIPRSNRIHKWQNFNSELFFESNKHALNELT